MTRITWICCDHVAFENGRPIGTCAQQVLADGNRSGWLIGARDLCPQHSGISRTGRKL